MNNELQTIASMEYGKAVHRLTKEKESSLRTALAGLSRGGPQVAARRVIELEYAEKMCTALAEIWVKLLEGTNGGILTRQHVEFIKEQVQGAASARRGSLMNGPPMAPNQEAVAGYIARQMDIVTANVCRDVELRLRRQEVGLPKEEPMAASAFPQSGQQQVGAADADSKFARLAIDEARKSVPENDGRPHPWVGAVVVKGGKVLSTAHRGEQPGNHAEYVALEKKLPDEAVAGSTVYTTLEPCTTRNHPKIPCAERLIERKVARVVIGMLDPNPDIRGRGDQLLSDAGIETQLFPRELRAQVEDMNREFIRSQKDRQASVKMRTTDEDQSSWPDVILECQWPSLVHESKIPGSHIVRKRPWMLRYRGPGAVYNVCVHKMDFGAYRAFVAPFSVPTLTDSATVYPIICRKSDGLVITAHDLESLIQRPPSGCDVRQYAVETDGNDGEEIQLEDFILEVEIPVTISYDDKNGNRYKIKYLLHYYTTTKRGEMIRIGGIEKVAPK